VIHHCLALITLLSYLNANEQRETREVPILWLYLFIPNYFKIFVKKEFKHWNATPI